MTASVSTSAPVRAGVLSGCASAVRHYHAQVEPEVQRARGDAAAGQEYLRRWREAVAAVPLVHTLAGLEVPEVALPELDEPGAVARYLAKEGLPGEFPYTYSAYPRMYLIREGEELEEPTRMFAGLGLPEDTNDRFHFLSRNQRTIRLSTACDGPTLYGVDSDAEGVLGKVGEGGVAVSTIGDMERLFAGFDLTARNVSVSMTINGPGPILMAQFVVAATHQQAARFRAETGSEPSREEFLRMRNDTACKLRGTVQADILKEIQAQNETLFPMEPSLRLLGDMVAYTTDHMPRWYPISISGYHIAEAGATPIEQLAFTVGNGLFYAAEFQRRGMDLAKVAPRLSFFFQFDHDLESAVVGRVARRLWAISLRDHFGIAADAAKLKFHTQTSGRSLIEQRYLNNITRTAVQLLLGLVNHTNSAHSNSYDEAITTPTAEAAQIASDTQALLLEESGLFRHMMGVFSNSPGLMTLTDRVEAAVLEIWDEIDRLGGMLAAVEQRYVRARIQDSFYRTAEQIGCGERRIIGVNCYKDEKRERPEVELSRTPRGKREMQAARVHDFKREHAEPCHGALGRLRDAALRGEEEVNVFEELLDAVEHATMGQIVEALQDCWGRFRPMI
ncbi:hypothetical protein HZA57_02870 [Candidatus Poribacteria bacterium]|nr:hypothetical protein [Candidatus Poribacteria bacterium]